MGIYLEEPNTVKHTETDNNDEISYAASGMQGILLKFYVKLKRLAIKYGGFAYC